MVKFTKNSIYSSFGHVTFILLISVFLLCLTDASELLASTRGKLSGQVLDANTGEPLAGVNVILTGTTLGAATDLEGFYFIANIPIGVYSVSASMIGYQEVITENVRIRINGTTQINFKLSQETLETEEIVVEAQRPPIEFDNTSTVKILEDKDIADRPTTVFTEVLATFPSINDENGVMTFRGGTLDQVAFIIDGSRLMNPMNMTPYTNINLSSVQEVEVVTGAFNAEYGEAQSGVVNIITKEGTDNYDLYVDFRYTPPGKKHWGTALYDQGSDLYWENANARHLDWWIENTDQWVDPAGKYGYEADCLWTPEEAYQDYMKTHQPLTDYTETPSYQTEFSLGGPIPGINDLHFYLTGRIRSQAALFGNSYRNPGKFYDGTLKLTYQFNPNIKLTFSGIYSDEKTSWGVDGPPDYWYSTNLGIDSRYAYYDYVGLPEYGLDSQTLIFSHVVNAHTVYEIRASRLYVENAVNIFPDDPIGWIAIGPTFDNLRAVDEFGNPIIGGYRTRVGYHTLGYYYRYTNSNTQYRLIGSLASQIDKSFFIKAGFEFSYNVLEQFNQSKSPDRADDQTYNPYQGAVYGQTKLEFAGFIMNLGLRFDFYNPNDVVYSNLFDPLNSPTEKTKLFTQFSPRLGVSHPIDATTKLHFSYGHFFQRPSFGDYGEGNEGGSGNLTTMIVDGTTFPWVLGNRNLKPEKTIAFEVGIEKNFWDHFVLSLTGYYKDIRNTIHVTSIETNQGVYFTNTNGDYADVRGLEASLNMLPANFDIGSFSGYFNYTTQFNIVGASGEPLAISQDGGVRYGGSGDIIIHNNPRLKAGIFYTTPRSMDFLAGLFGDITFSLEYRANFPNDMLRSDYFLFEGQKYLRPVDQSTRLRIRKNIKLGKEKIIISPYLEIHNLFNDQWIFLQAFENASTEDQRKFVESDFDYIPSKTATGVPYLPSGQYRNTPRWVVLGVSLEL